MEVNEKVFRYSPVTLALMFLAALIFGYAAFLSKTDYLLYLMGGYMFLIALQHAVGSVRISNKGITTTGLTGSKTMTWLEIDHVSMQGQGLRLYDRGEALILSIDPQLKSYREIVDLVFSKRPDLIDSESNGPITHFQFANLFQIGVGIALIALSLFLFFILSGYLKVIFSALAFVMGIWVIAGWLLSPQSITLVGRRLLVKYFKREVSYSADDIRSVSLEKILARHGYMYFVQIELKTGKKLKLTYSDLDRMYLSIKRWQEQSSLHVDHGPGPTGR